MLWSGDDGRLPRDIAPLSGVVAHRLGFDRHPSTGALWAIVAGEHDTIIVRPMTKDPGPDPVVTDGAIVRAPAGSAMPSRARSARC